MATTMRDGFLDEVRAAVRKARSEGLLGHGADNDIMTVGGLIGSRRGGL